MDSMSWCSKVEESIWFGNPLVTVDVVLLASSDRDLQHALRWFVADCEAARMRVSASRSEAMVH